MNAYLDDVLSGSQCDKFLLCNLEIKLRRTNEKHKLTKKTYIIKLIQGEKVEFPESALSTSLLDKQMFGVISFEKDEILHVLHATSVATL